MKKRLSVIFTPKVRENPWDFPDSPDRESRGSRYKQDGPFEIGEQLLLERQGRADESTVDEHGEVRGEIEGGEIGNGESEGADGGLDDVDEESESAKRKKGGVAKTREEKDTAKEEERKQRLELKRNVMHEDTLRERLRKIEKRLKGQSIPEIEKGCALFADLLLHPVEEGLEMKSVSWIDFFAHVPSILILCDSDGCVIQEEKARLGFDLLYKCIGIVYSREVLKKRKTFQKRITQHADNIVRVLLSRICMEKTEKNSLVSGSAINNSVTSEEVNMEMLGTESYESTALQGGRDNDAASIQKNGKLSISEIAWKCLKFMFRIPSTQILCGLVKSMLAVLDKKEWKDEEATAKIFNLVITTAPVNVPVAHLLMSHAQELATNYAPVSTRYTGFAIGSSNSISNSKNKNVSKSNSICVSRVSYGSEVAMRTHSARIEMLVQVLFTLLNMDVHAANARPSIVTSKSKPAAAGGKLKKNNNDHGADKDEEQKTEHFFIDLEALLHVILYFAHSYPKRYFSYELLSLPTELRKKFVQLDDEAKSKNNGQERKSNSSADTRENAGKIALIEKGIKLVARVLKRLVKHFKTKHSDFGELFPQIMSFAHSKISALPLVPIQPTQSHTTDGYGTGTAETTETSPQVLRCRTAVLWTMDQIITLAREQIAGVTNLYPYTDDAVAQMIVCWESGDWIVARHFSSLVANLLQTRLDGGIQMYKSRLPKGSTADDILAIWWAPFTNVQMTMLRDAIFNTLCTFCEDQGHVVASLWIVHETLLSAFGTAEVIESIPLILALEDYWLNFPSTCTYSDRISQVKTVEMLGCQRLFFLTFWLSAAKKYNCPELRKVCVSIMSEWANSGKLPHALNLNMFDLELATSAFDFVHLAEETEEDSKLSELPEKIDKERLFRALMSCDKGKRDKNALTKKFRECFEPMNPFQAAEIAKKAPKRGSVVTYHKK